MNEFSTADLLLWLTGSAGATIIVAVSILFEPFRRRIGYKKRGGARITPRKNKIAKFTYKLITCPMCLGIWFGSLFFTIHEFLPEIYRWIMYPCSTSLFAWLAYKSK